MERMIETEVKQQLTDVGAGDGLFGIGIKSRRGFTVVVDLKVLGRPAAYHNLTSRDV